MKPVVLHLVDLAKLSDGLEELICGACLLWLEEGEPEDLSIKTGAKSGVNLLGQAVVNDVFEVNVVKLVSPWMEHLEALMVHVLLSESLDVLLDEDKVGLVSFDRVAQVIFIDRLLVVSQEGSNGLDARGGLQILGSE
jgi:hypothetical protein